MTAQFNEILENTPVLIGGSVLVFLLLVWLIGRLTRRRSAEVDAVHPETRPLVAVPEPPLAPAFEPEPPALGEPSTIDDEPIAAAAPFDASPASLAADVAAPEPAPASADALTRLKGVGPRLADRLHTLGITSFAQIAALTPAEAEALDAQLGDFQGRVHRDRWIEQAGFLATDDLAGFENRFGKL